MTELLIRRPRGFGVTAEFAEVHTLQSLGCPRPENLALRPGMEEAGAFYADRITAAC